jgi:adenine nucleotide transporter 17
MGLDLLVNALAGSWGSMVAAAVVHPLDVTKYRVQAGRRDQNVSYFARVVADLRSDGLSIYRGLLLSLVRTAMVNFGAPPRSLLTPVSLTAHPCSRAAAAAFYFSYAALKNVAWFSRSPFALVRGFLHGITAGAVTQLTTLPIDLVLVRTCIDGQQSGTQPKDAGTPHPAKKSTWGHCRQIYREGGPFGFWAGLLPSLALTVNPGISMLLIEHLTVFVRSRTCAPRRNLCRRHPLHCCTSHRKVVQQCRHLAVACPFPCDVQRFGEA